MKIGILTYHSAYNYGSVLQAFATQQALESLGYVANLINYRMEEQRRFYQPLYRTGYGMKVWLKDVLQFPCHAKRLQRAARFENFFEKYFLLTKEVNKPEEVSVQWQQYDTIISGSDQIWNKHSYELEHNDWLYMNPYLLKGFVRQRISYASSVGSMTDTELRRILPELRSFDALSFRESVSAKKMAALLHKPVETVLDPTFLLTKDDWCTSLRLQKLCEEKYILVYCLGGITQLKHFLPPLSRLARKKNCKVKIVAPFCYLPYLDKRVEYHPEFGPIEFMNALYNADIVVTDSYHGTILSVNLEKEFYSICKQGDSEFRKTDILERLGLQDRIIHDAAMISELAMSPIDYNTVYAKLKILRQHSMNYLNEALKK